MKSFLEDRKHKTPIVNESNRQLYRGVFFFGGAGVFLMGVAFATVSVWAGMPLIIVGIGIMIFVWAYFGRIK